MKTKLKKISSILLLLVVSFVLSGCGSQKAQPYQVKLEVWGLFDDSGVYNEIINQYKKVNPYVIDIKYRKFTPESYQQDLIEALASGQGPDIFLIHNTWMGNFGDKVEPAPSGLLSLQEAQNNFPNVVGQDFAINGKMYAVPLTVDSLALYYNKDMFNAAGITKTPSNWQEFAEDVQKLVVIDNYGNIVRAGASIGTADNINRASDLLSLLLLQNGVQINDEKKASVKIDQGIMGPNGQMINAGENALGYYTQFARGGSPFYTWNSRMHNSIDAFMEGTSAMMINYSWQAAVIKAKSPKLNFGIAPIPQINSQSPVNYANYWAYAVSKNKVVNKNSKDPQVPNEVRIHEAWQFLKFLTTQNQGKITLYNAYTKNPKDFPISFDPAADYIKRTSKPAARKDLIEKQKSDIFLSQFALGNLIAKSWYQADPEKVDQIFSEAISSVNRGEKNLHEALGQVNTRLNAVIRSKPNLNTQSQ